MAQKQQNTKAPKGETVKVNLSLGIEQYRRLFVTSVMAGKTASHLVDELIKNGLRDWSMPGPNGERASKRQSTQSAPPAPSVQSQDEISGEAA